MKRIILITYYIFINCNSIFSQTVKLPTIISSIPVRDFNTGPANFGILGMENRNTNIYYLKGKYWCFDDSNKSDTMLVYSVWQDSLENYNLDSIFKQIDTSSNQSHVLRIRLLVQFSEDTFLNTYITEFPYRLKYGDKYYYISDKLKKFILRGMPHELRIGWERYFFKETFW